MAQLTQQQIAQLLPFDKEKALKFPDFVYWPNGHKCSTDSFDFLSNNPEFDADDLKEHLRLFPHRKVELWLVRWGNHGAENSSIVAYDKPFLDNGFNDEDAHDLNQSVTVLIFDETLLNK